MTKDELLELAWGLICNASNRSIADGGPVDATPGWQAAALRFDKHYRRGMYTARDAERVAREFHEAYEGLAPQFGYKTRKASAVPWTEVPADNRNLMVAVATRLLDKGVINV